jgi:hydroxymethylpyrimidine/phosphomethylpyrimidine kinase
MASQDRWSAISSEAMSVLVIAGRDSSGGAGVDADLDAARLVDASLKVVVTAETEQRERGLVELGARAPEDWVAEAEAEIGQGVSAIKFGLLPGVEHIEAAARLISRARALRPDLAVVVDPVLGPTHGGRFLGDVGVRALLEVLLPAGCILTPNLDEAAELTSRTITELSSDLGARIEAAEELLARGARGVVLKGGHSEGPLLDLICAEGAEPHWLRLERAPGSLRGTGCRHATILAWGLGGGERLVQAASEAGAQIGSLMRSQRQA